MRSILIKDMEMPSGCISCDFCNPFADEPYCRRLMRITPKVTRLKDCPLVEVPTPHGRLIDADALKASLVFAEKTAKWAVPALRAVLMVIDEMPTIIEAEEGKEA